MFNKIKTFRDQAWYSDNPLVMIVAHPIGSVILLIAACKAVVKMKKEHPYLWDICDKTERVGLAIYAMYRCDPEWIKMVKPESREWFKNWVEQARAELEAQ